MISLAEIERCYPMAPDASQARQVHVHLSRAYSILVDMTTNPKHDIECDCPACDIRRNLAVYIDMVK